MVVGSRGLANLFHPNPALLMKTNENATADPAASGNGLSNPNSLERTREILFGPNLREIEKRFGRLEERAEQAAPALRHVAGAGRGESNVVLRSETGNRAATSARLQEQGTLERQARAVLPEPDAG